MNLSIADLRAGTAPDGPGDDTAPLAGGAGDVTDERIAGVDFDPVEDEASLLHEEARFEAGRDD